MPVRDDAPWPRERAALARDLQRAGLRTEPGVLLDYFTEEERDEQQERDERQAEESPQAEERTADEAEHIEG